MTTEMSPDLVAKNYDAAKKTYALWGIDTEAAMTKLASVSLSIHCWQGDDVGGFENPEAGLSGGIQATGNYPGKARTGDELRRDFEKALSLIPGRHRLALHAIYAEAEGKRVERDAIGPELFSKWIGWARKIGIGLDFNQTYFSHPLAASNFTLSHADRKVRDFWIAHSLRCREIGEVFGKELGTPCTVNVWIPDGTKDNPADRMGPRALLKDSLDRIFARRMDPRFMKDAVEGKLFGIGTESYTVGSWDFYLAYAVRNGIMPCLDMGHFHPTESVADKLSSVLLFCPEVLLHVSRGVRWDSDHVVTANDDVRALTEEITRADAWGRVHFGLDYFDASINRIAAWVIGARASLRSALQSMLQPDAELRKAEAEGNCTARLALMEEAKGLPSGPVWDEWCVRRNVPAGAAWLPKVQEYERTELSKRAR